MEFSPLSSNQNMINRQYVEGLRNLQTFATRGIVADAAAQAQGEVAKILGLYGKALTSQYRNRRKRMTTINRKVGEDAQRFSLQAYEARVNQKNTPAYRATANGKWHRYAGGKMKKAISDPEFFRAAWDGVYFGNSNVMDRHAKQWYRLNFGAGPKGSTGPYKAGEYRLRFFGEASGAPVSLREYRPSEAYYMPRGLFLNRNSAIPQKLGASRGDVFHPRRAPATQFSQRGARSIRSNRDIIGKEWRGGLTAGFGGFHFLDAGVKRIAATWPIGLTRMIQEWVDEADRVGTGPVANLAVPAAELKSMSITLNNEMRRLGRQNRVRGFIDTIT